MISIAKSVRRFFILFFLILSVITTIVVSFGINRVISKNRLENSTREIKSFQASLATYLDLRIEVLKTYASLPMISQAVMQPQMLSASAKDLMEDAKFFGNNYGLTLLDFKGEIITTTDTLPPITIGMFPESKQFLSGETNDFRRVCPEDDGNYWLIGVPVLYNKHNEGALFVRIPMEELKGHPIVSELPNNNRIEICEDTTSFFSSGEIKNRDEMFQEASTIPGVSLKLYVDTDSARRAQIQLITFILLLFIAFWGITILITSRLSRKLIVNPILSLESDMRRVISSDVKKVSISKEHQISEIASFIEKFQDLAHQVHEREQSLLETQTELRDKNRELVQNQAKLLHADKMASIGQLAAGVAHEINNPVGFVLSNTRTLEEYISDIKQVIDMYSSGKSEEEILKYTESIGLADTIEDLDTLLEDNQIGLKRISSIVQNLKQFSYYDEDSPATPENINDLIDETLLIARNEIKYVTEVETKYQNLPNITLFRGEVNQVLLNIIINGVQVLKEMNRPKKENKLIIKTFMRGTIPTVSIFDNGKGVDPQSVKQIFDPFYSTKPIGSGTGLGLSISYDIIVNKHKGTLEVFSKEGVGTCFFISFPPIEEHS